MASISLITTTKQTSRFVLWWLFHTFIKEPEKLLIHLLMAKQGKERIVSAAFQLFLKKGYQGVSIKDIITESQLSKGAIYHHFDSKYDIYLAALSEYFFKFFENVSIESENLDFTNRIRLLYKKAAHLFAWIEEIGSTGISFPIRTYFIFQLESEKDEGIRIKIEKAMQDYRKEVVLIVQKAIDEGVVKRGGTAEVIGLQIMSMVEGMAIHHSALENDSGKFLLKKYDEVIGGYLDLITSA